MPFHLSIEASYDKTAKKIQELPTETHNDKKTHQYRAAE